MAASMASAQMPSSVFVQGVAKYPDGTKEDNETSTECFYLPAWKVRTSAKLRLQSNYFGMKIKIIKIKAKKAFTKTEIPGALVLNQYIGCQHACKYCYAKFMCKLYNYGKWGS